MMRADWGLAEPAYHVLILEPRWGGGSTELIKTSSIDTAEALTLTQSHYSGSLAGGQIG